MKVKKQANKLIPLKQSPQLLPIQTAFKLENFFFSSSGRSKYVRFINMIFPNKVKLDKVLSVNMHRHELDKLSINISLIKGEK